MRCCLSFALALLGLSVNPPASHAETLMERIGQPTVGYTAVQEMEADGQAFSGRVYGDAGKLRHEMRVDGMETVMVLRFDQGRAWAWGEAMPMVIEMDLDEAGSPLNRTYEEIVFEAEGEEAVNGVAATRHRLVAHREDGTFDGHLWLTPDNIVARVKGTVETPSGPEPVQLELSELERGAQPNDLFEPPAEDGERMNLDEMRQQMRDLQERMKEGMPSPGGGN